MASALLTLRACRSVAAAFTDLVKSFVSAILMPPIAIIFPLNKNIEEKFAVLRRGDRSNGTTHYSTVQQALDDGAVVMAYGYTHYLQGAHAQAFSSQYSPFSIAHSSTNSSHSPWLGCVYTAWLTSTPWSRTTPSSSTRPSVDTAASASTKRYAGRVPCKRRNMSLNDQGSALCELQQLAGRARGYHFTRDVVMAEALERLWYEHYYNYHGTLDKKLGFWAGYAANSTI